MNHTLTKRIIALLLTLAMVLSLVPSVFAEETGLPFTDVKEGKWYYDSVVYVYEHDLMKGMSETTFGPAVTLTRGMIVTILYRAAGEPAVTFTPKFEDVPAGRYYSDAVCWAEEKGITKGVSENRFAPADEVTREQMATFLYRYADSEDLFVGARENLERFPDGSKVHNWAKEAMQWAVAAHIINGVGMQSGPDMLKPRNFTNRAQVAAVLARFLQSDELSRMDGQTVILHTNDTHGALMGFAQVAKVKAEYEARGAKVILVDAGDYSQGTTYVSTNKGAAAVTMLNAAGYDFVTLGNHEFDFGYAQLMENMTKAEFQPIVADVLLKETGDPIFDGHVIKEVDGVKIGFFGMETPETFTKVNPGLIQEITFPQGEEMYACAQAEVDALKAEGADLVIGLVHLGVDAESEPNRSIDLYEHVTGIDFLIDGHSHTVMTEGPNGEPIQSTGTKASETAFMNVGFIRIDNETKQIEENKLIPLGADAPVDETVAAVAQEIMDAVDAEYGAKFAESLVDLNGDKAPGNRNMETNLGDLITDSMLWGVTKEGGLTVDNDHVVAITNGGGIRAWIYKGDVTKNDVNTVLPFGNTVAVVYVTGAELLEALEASTYSTPGAVGGFPQVAGMKINIDVSKPFDQGEQYPDSTYYAPATIQRVTIDEVGGQAFDPEATYAVVTNNFCAAGGDTYYAFKAASAQFDTGLPMDEVLMDYITTELGAVIGEDYAEPQGRITFEERTVEPQVDKTALQAAIAAAEAVDTALYTEESVAAMTEALNAAKAVYENAEATQAQVDAAVEALNAAVAALVEKEEPPVTGDEYVLTNAINDGDQVIIYHPTSGMAVSNADLSESQPNYRAGVAVTPVEDKITDPDAAIVWTASVTENGLTLADAEGNLLSMNANNLVLNGSYTTWEVRTGGIEGTVNVVNTAAPAGSSGDPRAIEWYSRYSEFTGYYLTNTSADFALQLFTKTAGEEPEPQVDKTALQAAIAAAEAVDTALYTEESVAAMTEALNAAKAVYENAEATQAQVDAAVEALNAAVAALVEKEEPPVTGDEYVLTNAINDGDQVIIYHPTSGMAVSNADLSESQPNYRAGVAVTPVEDKITDPDAAIVWTASVTENGLTLADAEGNLLSMNANNLVLNGSYTTWEVRTGGIEGTVNVVNTAAPAGSSGDPRAIEWYSRYSEFTGYYLTNTSADFALQLFTKTAEEEPTEKNFEFLVTSDLHGQIFATDYTRPYEQSGTYSRGLTRVATYIKEQKALYGENVYTVDMGDTFQGAPLTYYYAFNKPEAKDPAILAFRTIGYDMWVVGNHEFNYGLEILGRQMAYAVSEGDENEKQLTVSMANYLKAETNSDESKDWATWKDVAPYVIKDFDGFKVAVIGFGNPNIPQWDVPANWEGIYFADIIETYKHYEAEMLEQADMIVVVAHSGVGSDPGSDFMEQLVNETNTIAFAFSGHEHNNRVYNATNSDGKTVPILQPYTKARAIAQVKVNVSAEGAVTVTPEIKNMENYPLDEDLVELLQPYETDTWENYMLQPIGIALGDYPAANLGTAPSAFVDLINTVQIWGGYDRTGENTPDKTEDDAPAMLSITAPLTSGSNANLIPEGEIYLGDMFGLYRFENWFYQITMTGEEVHQWLEFAATKIRVDSEGKPYVTNGDLTYYDIICGDGFRYDIDVSKPQGQRVIRMTYNGVEVAADQVFTVMVNNYRYNGGGNYVSWLNAHGCEFVANDPDRIIYSTQFDMIQGEDEGQARALLVSYIKDQTEKNGGITPTITSTWTVVNGEELAGQTVILHTNDTHGALMGFAQVAKVKAEYEARGAKVILVDAGDYSQGTTYVSTNKGAAAVTMLNAAGYDFVTLGNHEFDFGYAQLMENMTKAEFQPIVADVLLKETGDPIFDGHVIKEVDGVKIGFFGMETPETFTKVNPGLIQEITFPQGEEMYACAQAEVDALKADGADLVIGLVHLGVDAESEPNRSIDLYEHVTGIDFLIDGHSHTVMTEGPNGEPIQSTGTKASETAFMNVGFIRIDNETKQIEENKLIPLGADAPVDETVAAVAQEIMDAVDAEYDAKFAESLVDLNGDKAPGNRNMETNLGDLITDSMRWGVLKDMNAETLGVPEENVVAITNGGGIRAWIYKGDVTKNDVNTVLPFGNTVAVVYVTGAELLEALEASTYSTPGAVGGFPQVAGMKINIDVSKSFDQGEQYPDSTYYAPATIQRVTIDEVGGQAFDPEATYAVVTNNFCAAGGDTYYAFKAASAQFDTGLPMDEVLMDYITTELNAVIGEDYAEPQGRITFEERVDGLCFPSTSNDDIAKYGNIYTNVSGADFFAQGFTWGDVVTVEFLDQELELPVVPTFSYVDQGTPGVFVNKDGETGEPTGRMFMAINMGDFATTYGLAVKTTNADKTYFWTAVEGVEFPVPVTVTMKEAGGYAAEMAIRDINRTDNREDYPELTDAEFANFRQITTTGMGDHLYRGSSPINPEIGRNTYADAELEKAGVTVIMNLANDQATAEAYPGYADTYYSGQNIIFLNLSVDFQAADFQAGLANGLRYFAENAGVYYVHCTEGKDRAGFVSALLECFMGATYDEVVADYLKTYTNYFNVVDGVQQPLPQETLDAIANSNIIKTLQSAFAVEDLTTADLAAEAEEYIAQIGLTEEEIANLRANLGDVPAHDHTDADGDGYCDICEKVMPNVFVKGLEIQDGDQVVIYNAYRERTIRNESYNNQYLYETLMDPALGTLCKNPAENLIWTVHVDADGVYTFTQGDNAVSLIGNSYLDLTNDPTLENANTGWILETADEAAGSKFVKSATVTGSSGSVYLTASTTRINNRTVHVAQAVDTAAPSTNDGAFLFYVHPAD